MARSFHRQGSAATLLLRAGLLGALLLGPAARAQTPPPSLDAILAINYNGIPLSVLNTTGITVEQLRARLQQLADQNDAFSNFVISSILTLLTNSTVSIFTCGIGTYTDAGSNKCTQCPAGTFSVQALATSNATCQSCPRGAYSEARGATSADACTLCGLGTYSAALAASSPDTCVACKANAVTSAEGAQSADACACQQGFYPDADGACGACPAGYYSASGVQNWCPQADEGLSFSDEGSTSINDCYCLPGYHGSPITGCQACGVGFYCPGGKLAEAVQCPASSGTAGPRATSLNDCVCDPGFRELLAETAVRSVRVDSSPCQCTNTYPCVNGSCMTCYKDLACSAGKTITCPQAYFNIQKDGSGTNYVANQNKIWWKFTPPARYATSVLTFTAFCLSDGTFMNVYECATETCATKTSVVATLTKNGFGGPCATFAPFSVSTVRTPYMYVNFTSGAAVSTGFAAEYQTTLPCNPAALDLTYQSVAYAATGQVDRSGAAVLPTMVVFYDDTLQIASPGLPVDVFDSLPPVPGAGLSFAGEWNPRVLGRFYIVDLTLPTRYKAVVVAPLEPTVWDVYLENSATASGFALSGDVRGTFPSDAYSIILTTGDTLILSRIVPADATAAVTDPMRLSLKNAAGEQVTALGQGSLHITWITASAEPGTYTYTSAEGYSGRILLTARPGYKSCTECLEGEYCFRGVLERCPANARSSSLSSAPSDCKCNAGFYQAPTDVLSYVNSQNVDTGGRHSCAVTEGNRLYCWGANEAGQLGLGRTSEYEPPSLVGLLRVQFISLGDDFTCAAYTHAVYTAEVRVRCWGGNGYGQLGQDRNTNPVAADPADGGTVLDAKLSKDSRYTTFNLSCAAHTCCASIRQTIDATSYLTKCWGDGKFGQLGNSKMGAVQGTGVTSGTYPRASSYINTETATAASTYIAVTDLRVVSLSVGGEHACLVIHTGALYCWGYNENGQTGLGTAAAAQSTPALVSLPDPARTVNCYAGACCVLTAAATVAVRCFGKGADGRLGTGLFNVGDTPGSMGANLQAVNLNDLWAPMDVNVGGTATCVLLSNNHVKCWGQVGGTTVGANPALQMFEFLPDIALQSGRVALQIAGKGPTTCVILSNYRVACWGGNDFRQLGAPTATLGRRLMQIESGPHRAPTNTLGRRLMQIESGPHRGQTEANTPARPDRNRVNTPARPDQNRVNTLGRRLLQIPVPQNLTNMTVVPLPADALHSAGTPLTLTCAICPDNAYCAGNDNTVALCPQNSNSLPMSVQVSDCRCYPGYATVGNSLCQVCNGTRYCIQGSIMNCPDNAATLHPAAWEASACGCNPGYSGPLAGPCHQCEQGTYKPTAGNDTCTPCPAGTHATEFGANASHLCRACPAGTFSGQGATACTACQAGFTAAQNSSACKECEPGSYAAEGAPNCTQCPAGTYDTDAVGGDASSCKKCLQGSASNITGATSAAQCGACPAGYHAPNDGASACTPCAQGSYSFQGAPACISCPANANTSGPASTLSGCSCNAGYVKVIDPLDMSTPNCTACPQGAWSAGSATECTGCAAGTYQQATGATAAAACAACQAGYYSDRGAAACTQCPAGSVAPATASPNCSSCALGYFAARGSSACTPCPKGSYSLDANASSAASCRLCPPGYYCPGPAVNPAQQVQCPVGTYQGLEGANAGTACKPCMQGYYCPTPALQTACPTGTSSNGSAVSQLQCSCTTGYVCTYAKVVQAIVTLFMDRTTFDLYVGEFRNAVAEAAKVVPSNVRIVDIKETPTQPAARRLLQKEAGIIQVFVTALGADSLEDLDLHLQHLSLPPALEHGWYAPHAVTAQRAP